MKKPVFMCEYSSDTKDFSRLPPKVRVSLPEFSSKTIHSAKFCKLFGYLSPLSTTTEENGYEMRKPKKATRVLLEKPKLITTINTGVVNKVKNGQTEEVIRLQDWTPLNMYVTNCGDLLITMYNVWKSQTKVVRYSGSTEKQIIQFDEKGKPLYSGNYNIKYITENGNLDICVADWEWALW
ncbi:uncharacterized protein LOC134281844 [Saccostrea cucullata]|uniref:uncharacterized protein LOC134281844 n=1 Tax=Saccostrea cuccullata TaxID=36930 RepID=UPI002ED36120